MTDEDDDLNAELARGDQAQIDLCHHLHRMGASKCENKVEVIDEETGDLLFYHVEVRLEGRIKNPKV